ncbi:MULTISPECIES: DUF2933 domain-containing protein [Alphaproteobacteria]|uniref:DUF2933 domain-containing protein n=1 Tax=Alphaproteobacteria TaxID=28211 RepID=UPI003267B38D
MDWLSQNWVWVLIGIAFVALHLFGHGGHGSHGGRRTGATDSRSPDERRDDNGPTGHGH